MPEHIDTGKAPAVLRVARASTVDLITTELRNAIYAGALAVGSQLGEVEIAAQLGVSRSPLREAAQRLVQEGVLTATPGRGLRVSQLSMDQIPDLYEARAAVECQAARLVIRRRDEAAVAGVEAAFARIEETSAGTDARSIGDADLDFHWALVDGSGSNRLRRYMSTLILETRMVSYSLPDGYVVRRDVSQMHWNIVEALKRWDTKETVGAIVAHMEESVARLTGHLAQGITVDTVEGPHTPGAVPLEPIGHH